MGHPRLRTYDSKNYNVVGKCDYTFTSDCLAENKTFEVITKNTESHRNSSLTYTDSVLVIFEDYVRNIVKKLLYL